MKKMILAMTMLLGSVNAFADGKCYLQKLDSNGSFADYLIKKEGVRVDGTAPVVISSDDGQYSLEITKMTQANMNVNVLKGGKLVLQTLTIGINSNFQWVRSTAVMNADNSGLSLWCTFSN